MRLTIDTIILSLLLLALSGSMAFAERIKDLVDVKGVSSNPLVGYGLVVGLDGKGDGSNFTKQSFKSMLA